VNESIHFFLFIKWNHLTWQTYLFGRFAGIDKIDYFTLLPFLGCSQDFGTRNYGSRLITSFNLSQGTSICRLIAHVIQSEKHHPTRRNMVTFIDNSEK
jgi:hypothetical protein